MIKKYTIETTGIAEGSNLNSINLYPNPSQKGDQISISGISGSCEIDIYNAQGQKVVQQLFEQDDEIKNLKIDYNLAAGLYTVSIRKNDSVIQKKLIISE